MVSLTSYLTDGIVAQLMGYWQRLSAVRMVPALKMQAILDGMPKQGPFDRCVIAQAFEPRPGALGIIAPVASWNNSTGGGSAMLGATDSTSIAYGVGNLGLGLTILEGLCTNAADQTDLTAILDLIEMISFFDKTKTMWQQGLPDISAIPALDVGPGALNDFYYRALISWDTKGASTDQQIGFPCIGDSALSNLIPISGKGVPDLGAWTLFGAPKAVLLDSTVTKTYADAGSEYILFGTSPLWASPFTTFDGAADYGFKPVEELYTPEDGWTDVSGYSADFGDGAGIKAAINKPVRAVMHKFFPAVFGAQLTTSLEYRFLDTAYADYNIYMSVDDLCLAHGVALAQMLGVPGLV
jgi:hypothetical protein